jgi:hypothetical protein
MYHLIHTFTVSQLFKHQLPVFALALVIAELFYKFHSFAVECAAFLVTWYVLDAIAQWIFPVGTSTADAQRSGNTPGFQGDGR